MIENVTQETWLKFRQRSIDGSRDFNPMTSSIDLPSLEVLTEAGVKFMTVPAALTEDEEVLLAVTRAYNDFKLVKWNEYTHILSVNHSKFENCGDVYKVRGVLKEV